MIDPVPEAVPHVNVVPAAEIPDSQKPKKPDEEQKFAHQLEHLVVKEQRESERAKKVEEEKRESPEGRGRQRGSTSRSGKSRQLAGFTTPQKEKRESDEDKKGRLLDIRA